MCISRHNTVLLNERYFLLNLIVQIPCSSFHSCHLFLSVKQMKNNTYYCYQRRFLSEYRRLSLAPPMSCVPVCFRQLLLISDSSVMRSEPPPVVFFFFFFSRQLESNVVWLNMQNSWDLQTATVSDPSQSLHGKLK